MAELAQVIVDVPTLQTNRPYTYQIPERLENQVQVGMRVIVPFGNGHREVQGFIVGLDQPSDYDGHLKKITALMDLTPVVNSEMLALSKWLADQTYSFWISCLYTMLPNALKAKSTRVVRIIDDIDENDRQLLFNNADQLNYASVQDHPELVSRLLKLRRQGKVSFEYQVNDRARVKTAVQIEPALSFEQYENLRDGIRSNAKNQLRLVNYLQTIIGKKVLLKEARQSTGLSAAPFTQAIKKGWIKSTNVEVYRQPIGADIEDQAARNPLQLNSDQQTALDQVTDAIDQEHNQVFLL